MKNVSRMICALALTVISSLASADAPASRKPKRPESPEIYTPPPAGAPASDLELLRLVSGNDDPKCAEIKVNGPVHFRGRTLVEIPDIDSPDLRLANRLVSSGCYSRALDKVEKVLKADPANFHADYVLARLAWVTLGTDSSERILKKSLAEHEDFVSAKVLLAGIRYEARQFDEAEAMFDELEPKSPNDMWIFMGRLRLEGRRSRSPDLGARLMEVVTNPAFPPNAREAAAFAATRVHLGPQQYEALLRARLDIDSNQSKPRQAYELAVFLAELKQNFAEVIQLLDSPRAAKAGYLRLKESRKLLAYAYLKEAVKISKVPDAGNQKLIDRAHEVLQGEYDSFGEFVRRHASSAELQPFLPSSVKVD